MGQIKRISEAAYFVVEIRDFTKTVNTYDPRISNQMISAGFSDQFEEPEIEVPPVGEGNNAREPLSAP